jgi:hypothetical protein
MKLSEFNRLKKLMQLATSDNDHEALASLRQATQLLRAHGYTWEDFFKRTVKVTYEYDTGTGVPPDEERIDNAFQILEGGKRWNDFIGSLYDQWQKRRSLSDKQKETLFRAAGEA